MLSRKIKSTSLRLGILLVIAGAGVARFVHADEKPRRNALPDRRSLQTRYSKLRAFNQRQQDAWKRNFRNHRPKVKIQSIRVLREPGNPFRVVTLIYYPEVDLGTVNFLIDGKVKLQSHGGQPNNGKLLGTCSFEFSFAATQLPNGKHRVTVQDSLTGDTDSRIVWVKGGRVTKITKS